MRTALTIGVRADGTAKLIAGPEVAILAQRHAMKHRLHAPEDFVNIHHWESGTGITKSYEPRRRPAPAPATKSPAALKPDPYAAELAKLDHKALAEVVQQFEVALPADATREQTIAAILAKNAELERAAT